jgi:Mn-containing catalase
MTREITHMKAFTAALESLRKAPFSIGKIPPTSVLVDQYFNDSTGVGDEGETDARGPWNEGGDWKIVEKEQLEEGVETLDGSDPRDVTNNVKKRSSQKETVQTRKRA